MAREVVVLSGVRTAIGGYGGSLKDIPPSELAAKCVREAVNRATIDPKAVGHVVFGNVIHTDSHDHYLARVAAIKGGLPHRDAGADAQPSVRQRPASDHHRRPGDHARRRRRRGGRRRGKHEPQPLFGAGDALGGADERHHLDRRHGRRAERSVRRLPHGRHGRERRQEVEHLARRSGRAGRRKPSPRGHRDRQGLLQGADRAGRGQGQGETMPFEVDETVRRDSTVEKLARLQARCSIQEAP